MAAEWQEVAVEDLKADTHSALATGPFGSSIGSKLFVDVGVPVIRGSNLSEDVGTRLNDSGLVFVSSEKALEFQRSRVREGDLIFTCWGTVNQIGLIDGRAAYREYIISNKQMKLTPNPAKADSLFLYYLFSGPELQERIKSQSIGSSVSGFNLGQLREMRLQLPEVGEQRAIAHILGTLDDKIELNRRMNETLEAIARAIFKSWFVNFDPVRAKASGEPPESICRRLGLTPDLLAQFPDRLVDSALGEIPEGWDVGILADTADNPRRGIQPSRIPAGTPYIALEHMPRRCIALSEWGAADAIESNKFEFKLDEILFGKLRPYFHKVGVAAINGVCSTDIVVIAPKSESWFGFVLGHASSDPFVEHTNAGSTGTKMPRTSWADMARYPIAIPRVALAEAFTHVIRPFVERIVAGIHESRSLAAARDTLLPKLLSGEFRVPAEDFVPEPMT